MNCQDVLSNQLPVNLDPQIYDGRALVNVTAKLEDIRVGSVVDGLGPSGPAEVVAVNFHGSATTVVYRDQSTGHVGQQLVYRSDEDRLTVREAGRSWAFDADGELFRLTAEAHRIRLAYLFDPLLAVHISNVEPLPHQIAAVYEEMLIRQPLRFLLADDPGAGSCLSRASVALLRPL